MKKFFFNNKINILFLTISFLCLIGVVGVENISFKSTKWLHIGNDSTLPQLSWHFFVNDIWRFPLGSNPNYGIELGSSIVFSDSIPLLALFFKLFKTFIHESFQYISFWYFICFYLQLFFSFKILKKFTNSNLYSFVGSIFFLFAPIFIYRLQLIPALAGQWILLCTLYLGLTYEINKSKLPWVLLIVLSSLINFYFIVMILAVYSILRLFNLKFEKKILFNFLKDFTVIGAALLLALYIVGYFEVRLADTLALGFGRDKLNLLSIFDSVNSNYNTSWSWFMPDIRLTMHEEEEGFNYFGLGQIVMISFSLFLLFNKNYKTNLLSIKSSKEIKIFIFISIFMTLWALSNKISFGPYTLLEIPLHKYIFGALSIVRPTGRMFWIVNYFFLILSLIIIFKCFNKKNSILIISLFLIIQIADISKGIRQHINLPNNYFSKYSLNDQIWSNLFKKYKIVKSSYIKNYSGFFHRFSYSIEKYDIKKTNIVKLARINRKAVANAKYSLYHDFRNKNLSSDTIYLIDGLGHLRHLKYLFKNENVGFFYRDNIWAMVLNEKELMNENDKKIFNEVRPKLLPVNKKENLNFRDEDNYYGFGWSHNMGKSGIWSEGSTSTLFFRTDKNYENLKLEINCQPYITRKNDFSEFDIYVNNIFNQNIRLTKNDQDEKIEILINKEMIKGDEIKIDFNFKNPISPYEVFESPDSRKLGILIKNIKINLI